MNYFFLAFKNYAVFTGRARRREYWYFVLFYNCIYLVLKLCELYIGSPFSAIQLAFVIISLLPYLAVSVRRMHDVDRSGWYSLIPIYSLILNCTDGTNGPNDYGPDPKNGQGYGADDYERPFDINPPQTNN